MKLYKLCNASFFAALGLALDNTAGQYIHNKSTEISQFLKMHYTEIETFSDDLIPGNPDFPDGDAVNGNLMAAVYGDSITKTFEALNFVYSAISLIDLQKDTAFDASDTTDRTLSSNSDTTSNSSTTYDSNNPVLTGTSSHTYTRSNNADTTLDHDTSEHTTGTDGRRSPQELIQTEIDFRAKNVFMNHLCMLCKSMFGSGVYKGDDI